MGFIYWRLCQFPWCKYSQCPVSSCQISEYVVVESYNPIQARFNTPQEEHVHILSALHLGWCQVSITPRETQNTSLCVGACLLPIHGSTWWYPDAPCFCITPFISQAVPPPWAGDHCLTREIQCYLAGTCELKITFGEDYPLQSHPLLCTH